MEDQVRFRLPFGIFSLPFYEYARRQRILISGGSGAIGKVLVAFLKICGHEVIRLVRDPMVCDFNDCSQDVHFWDPYQNIIDIEDPQSKSIMELCS